MVEEEFLAPQVFGECLVVVEMVMGQIGEYPDLEFQSGDSFLFDSYRADFHEAIFAAGICHLGQQGIDGERVGCGIHGLAASGTHVVGYRRQESAFVAETSEQVVQQGDRSGLSVRACYADKTQFP